MLISSPVLSETGQGWVQAPEGFPGSRGGPGSPWMVGYCGGPAVGMAIKDMAPLPSDDGDLPQFMAPSESPFRLG